MMHTRFAYTPSNTMPLSPRAAGSIRDSRPPPPPPVTVYAHSQIFHDPTWHPIPGRDGPRSPHTTTRERTRRPVIDSTATPSTANARERANGRARGRDRANEDARSPRIRIRIGIHTRHVDARGSWCNAARRVVTARMARGSGS